MTCAATALAQPASVVTGIAACRGVVDATARLACYDALPLPGAATAVPGATAAAPQIPSARGAVAPAPVAAAPASFGLERPLSADTQEISSRFDGDFEGWGPTTRVRLANGQVWQVIDGSSAALYLRSPRITVKRAMMGGFVMEFEGSNRTAKVRRLE